MAAQDPEEAIELARELILEYAKIHGVKYLTLAEIERIMGLAKHFSDKAEELR